jgi:hypothetical protein
MSKDTYRKNTEILIVVANSSFNLPQGWTIKMKYSDVSVLNQLEIYSPKKILPIFYIELRDITSIFINDPKTIDLKRIYSEHGHSFNNFVENRLCLNYANEVLDEWERQCFPKGKSEFIQQFNKNIHQEIGEKNV